MRDKKMNAFERLALKPQLDGPKRQHYISQFYLESFSDNDGLLKVFDRNNGQIRIQQPKDTAVIGHFYTFSDEQDRRRFELENFFGIIEDRASSALKSIMLGESLSQSDRENLAFFVAMTAVRTPSAFEEAKQVKEAVERHLIKLRFSDEEKAYAEAKKLLPATATEEELRKFAADAHLMFKEDRFSVQVPQELGRQLAIKQLATIAKIIYDRDWTVVDAPEGATYLTSDSPTILVPNKNFRDQPIGFASLHAHILFPVSKKVALVMNGDGGRFRRMDVKNEQVHRFNISLATDCHRFIIGTDVNYLRDVANESLIAGTSWKPRVNVEIATHPVSGEKLVSIVGRGVR